MSSSKTFQEVIFELQRFWADLGCVIWQPHHTEVGAGTMNPATAIRVLGPEPWNVAYVEPSFRPADGRYGENPNRWQQYFQFQVILKPDPGNPQELYLESLKSIGIDPLRHDIRFVEDNWEAPPLGAWGLGWEVWLDGQEITQFTYFQQSGGHALDPVAVEITYGLERIVMALQDANNFLEIDWDQQLKYGEILLAREQQHSTYNFEIADIERVRTLFDEYEAEAQSALERGLTFPAHDYVLKCSHSFNLLDTRGAIGVTERAALFSRMRVLSSQVADNYLEQREDLGFPWMDRIVLQSPPSTSHHSEPGKEPEGNAEFLLEIGTEELPSKDLQAGVIGLRTGMEELLKESRLEYEALDVFGTPRRLVVSIANLAPEQTGTVTLAKGPPAERSFDQEGKPTEAAEGFAKSKGVPVESLRTEKMDGGEYVVAEVQEPTQSATKVLAGKLSSLIDSLRFEKSMRWNASEKSFSRPIRWLLALHGSCVIPFSYAGVKSERFTRGLRFHDPEVFEIEEPKGYFQYLEDQGILLDGELRRARIHEDLQVAAAEAKGELVEDEFLLVEVVNLVEQPSVLCGSFEQVHLDLPRDVLTTVMKVHQRYFPLESEGKLLPQFLFVRNGGSEFSELVIHGNEQVIQARFADAAFFIQQDEKQPLDSFVPQLATLTFQTKLGSMLDKANRIEQLVDALASELNLSDLELVNAMRAAYLCKADLATRMVVEMTSLQGVMGREYALKSGEAEPVANAINEHYLPRFSGDSIPISREGLLVGLADRLDTLMGLFSLGLAPTGTSDPYALRRTAIGLIQCLLGSETTFDLVRSLQLANEQLPNSASEDSIAECLSFITTRQKALLLSEGHPHDGVDAVLAEQERNPLGVWRGVVELETWRGREDWLEILQAYSRCARIIRSEELQNRIQPELFVENATKGLYRSLQAAESSRGKQDSIDDFLNAFVPMIPSITKFFDEVLVMAEDERLRENRLDLVGRIVNLAKGAVDLSYLEGF